MGHILPRLKERHNAKAEDNFASDATSKGSQLEKYVSQQNGIPMCYNITDSNGFNVKAVSDQKFSSDMAFSSSDIQSSCITSSSQNSPEGVKVSTIEARRTTASSVTSEESLSISSSIANCSETTETGSSVPTDYLQALNLNRIGETQSCVLPSSYGSTFLYAQILCNCYSIQREKNFDSIGEGQSFEMIFPESDDFCDNSCSLGQKRFSIIPKEKCTQHKPKKYYICKYGLNFCEDQNENVTNTIIVPKIKKIPKVCTVCQKVYPDANRMKLHLLTHSKPKKYKCEVCNKGFAFSSSLWRHRKQHPKCQIKHPKRTSENVYKCKLCPSKFPSPTKLRLHLLKHSSLIRAICDICNKTFMHTSSLRRHELTHKKKIIKRSESNIVPFKKHTIKVQCNKRFSCKLCKKVFTSYSSLTSHSRVHSATKKFKCKFCDKYFSTLSEQCRHQKIHFLTKQALPKNTSDSKRSTSCPQSKSYRCKSCSKSFPRQSLLTKHTAAHKLNKPFACDICANKYTVLSSLNRHKKVHKCKTKVQCVSPKLSKTSVKSKPEKTVQKCNLCSKPLDAFNGISSATKLCLGCQMHSVKDVSASKMNDKLLSRHMTLRQPTGEQKPNLDCKDCGKTFRDSRTYFTHLKLHTAQSQKSFQCPVCNRKYQQRSVMKRHVKSQHRSFPQDKL